MNKKTNTNTVGGGTIDKKNEGCDIYKRDSADNSKTSTLYSNKNDMEDMQSAYLCALQLQTEFLGCLANPEHPSTHSRIVMSKDYYWDLKIKFDNYYQKKRRRVFRISKSILRRKSLNLNEQASTQDSRPKIWKEMINVRRNVSCDSVDVKKIKLELENSIGAENPENISLKLRTLLEHSDVDNKFNIVKFAINRGILSFKEEDLPLTRESVLDDVYYRLFTKKSTETKTGGEESKKTAVELELKILRGFKEISDDQIESLIFGEAHNFKDYSDSPLRELLQLVHATSGNLLKEYCELKLLQETPVIDEVNDIFIRIYNIGRKLDEKFFDYYTNRLKEVIFDLYFYFNRDDLDKTEIQIFNKIIYWLTGLKQDLSHKDVNKIFNRVKIDLVLYNSNYSIVVGFVESLI